MFDKKFLDLILVGEYFILVAVYLTLRQFTTLFSVCWEKSCFFFLTLLLSSFCLSLCPPRCCCTVGCVLLILDLPLLRSSVIICWNCLLTPPSTNEFFSSISRLLLTKLKSELTLTIERVIDCLFCILLVTKEVKWVSLLFC